MRKKSSGSSFQCSSLIPNAAVHLINIRLLVLQPSDGFFTARRRTALFVSKDPVVSAAHVGGLPSQSIVEIIQCFRSGSAGKAHAPGDQGSLWFSLRHGVSL